MFGVEAALLAQGGAYHISDWTWTWTWTLALPAGRGATDSAPAITYSLCTCIVAPLHLPAAAAIVDDCFETPNMLTIPGCTFTFAGGTGGSTLLTS
jgi:hypothetical protein